MGGSFGGNAILQDVGSPQDRVAIGHENLTTCWMHYFPQKRLPKKCDHQKIRSPSPRGFFGGNAF